MSFVDVTGTVDADTDGIVFEGKPGLERPIIPRFIVPKNLARKISALTEGDALEIEKQRRSGNSEISFDENKLRSIIQSVGGDSSEMRSFDERRGMSSMSMSDDPDNPDFYSNPPDEPPYDDSPQQYDALWTPDEEQLRDLDRRMGREPQEEPAPIIGDKYEIVKSNDGVYYAKNISAEDVRNLRNGRSKPPRLPFFAPLGGGNDTETGEGYYFAKNGKRYWGKYGAAGALVRRKNKDGEYEYFLARRNSGMSTGGGKWSFPGGAHRDRESSLIPGETAREEFRQEVGGDLSSLQPVFTYKDQVAPDWAYETQVFEVGPQEMDDLRALDGENTDTGWFTASDIMQMAQEGELLESFKKSATKIFKDSGDKTKTRKTTKKPLAKLNDEQINSWREKIREYKPLRADDYFEINSEMQSDFGISIGQLMQEEYDEGASIQEIANNWGITTHEVEKLLDDNGHTGMSSTPVGQLMQEEYDDGASIQEIAENWGLTVQQVDEMMSAPRRTGMESARVNREARGRDATPKKESILETVAGFIMDKASPLTVFEAVERALERRREEKNPQERVDRLAREAKKVIGVDRPGKSGIAIAEKMKLQEYAELMDAVNMRDGATVLTTAAKTAEIQTKLDKLAETVDGDLDGMDFSKGNFAGVDFGNYSLKNVSFYGANLDNANFSGTVIEGSTFEDASLVGANLRGIARAWNIDFSGANLTNSDLRQLNMHSVLFNDTNVTGANFDGANMIMSDIRQMDFSVAKSMRGVLLEEVQGDGANFNGLDMTNSSLVGARLTNANFTNTNLKDSTLRAANLDGSDFTDANLENVELQKRGLSPASTRKTIFNNEVGETQRTGMESRTDTYKLADSTIQEVLDNLELNERERQKAVEVLKASKLPDTPETRQAILDGVKGGGIEVLTDIMDNLNPDKSIGDDADNLARSLSIHVASNGIPAVTATPHPVFNSLIPDQRDWQYVEAPTPEAIRRVIEQLSGLPGVDEELSPSFFDADVEARDKIASEMMKLVDRHLEKLGIKKKTDEQRPTGTYALFYLDSLEDPYRASHTSGEVISGFHDAIGHLGTGRGFDRHGEYANALATVSVILHHPEMDLTPEERERAARWWLRESTVAHLMAQLNWDDRTNGREITLSLINQQENEIRSIFGKWPGTTEELIDALGVGAPPNRNLRSGGMESRRTPITEVSEGTLELANLSEVVTRQEVLNQGLASRNDSDSKLLDMPQADANVPEMSDEELSSKLDDNVNALNELEKQLDDGEIDLAEYRKRQVPLRKEGASLGAEKKRRSGSAASTPTEPTGQKRESVISRGSGMIERDERGNPTKWDGKKFLDEQAEKRRQWILGLGFTPEEADALLGAGPDSERTGVSSKKSTIERPTLTLTPSNLFVKKVNSRKKGGTPEYSEWADREIANALSIYDIRAPRDWNNERGSFIPSWFPSKDSLIQELNHRGYDVYLGTGESRRYNDLTHTIIAKRNADSNEMRRRIWRPSGLLQQMISDKEDETNQVFPMKSRIQRWDFGSRISDISDAELRAMDAGFDSERANKLSDVRSGALSKEQFNDWYENQLTPLRRVLSAELTRRRLRSTLDEKQVLDSVFGDGINPKEYAFLSKDPAIFTRRGGMLSRRSNNNQPVGTIERMIANGELTESDIEFLNKYHNIHSQMNDGLRDELGNLFGEDPELVDWGSLDPEVQRQARQIQEQWMRKFSHALSQLGEENDKTPAELDIFGFDQGEIDDIMSGRSVGMESRKKRRKPTQKWTEEEKRIFSEQKLRSKKIPKKRKSGPGKNEWSERRAGREVKSTSRVSGAGSPVYDRTSYYDALANQYFFGLAEYIGQDTRLVNRNFNPLIPSEDGPFMSIRISPVSMLREGDVLPDGFESIDMWGNASNPRYKVVYFGKKQDGMHVIGLRDAKTGELVIKKLNENDNLPNVMRPSSVSSRVGMTSARKVNDVKLQARLTQKFQMEQFDEIDKDFENLLDELDSVNAQIDILDKNMTKRREAGVSDDGFLESDDNRWSELEDIRAGIEDKIDEYVKFAEFVAQENIERRRHTAAVALAKQRISSEQDKRESPGRREIFQAPDMLVTQLYDFGASEDDVRELIDQMDIGDEEMQKVFTAGRPPFTGTKFAKRINDIISKRRSSVDGPEFEEFDKDDDDEKRIIEKMAEKIIRSAAVDIARKNDISNPNRTVIETTATDITPQPAALGPGMTSSRTPMGKDLGISRVIYPTKPNKFIAKDVSFVSYDANRQELSVGYKDKKKYIFGGITPGMVDDIENGDRTLIASLNAIKKDARYTINPDGSSVGNPPNTYQLLNRDKNRLNLSGDDLEIAESVMNDLKNGQEDMTRKMRMDRRNEATKLASGLAQNNEYAMAFNIMDALDEIDKGTKGSGYMPDGMRSYARTNHQRIMVGMSQDEIGEIRDEISAIRQKYRDNFFINHGLMKYDDTLASAQKRTSGGGRGEIAMMQSEYDAIMDSYEELAKVDPDWAFVVGPHPIEMAGVSIDGRFDTEKYKSSGDFAGKLINNGAPADITVGEQKELIHWARQQPGFRIVQSIASSYDEKNGTLTANQWRTLRSLHRNYGKNQYRSPGVESRRERVGMRSEIEGDERALNAVSANPMGQFIPYGETPEGDTRSRVLTPNQDLKGKTIQEAIPEGLSDEEQLAVIEQIGQYSPKTNPDGIRGKDFTERRTALLDSIASRRRLEERRAALERAKQSGQIGDDVNLPPHLEFWPLVSEDTKSKLNKAAERKYGVQFIDLEPHQMEDVLVFETGASGYYSGGKFKKIKKRPDAIEMEDWERLILPINKRVDEVDSENRAQEEARKLQQQNAPSLEEMLNDPSTTPEQKARIENILKMRKDSDAKWRASADAAASARRRTSAKDIKLERYESIDDVGPNGTKNVLGLAKSKYDTEFDALTDAQKRDVLDTYAKEKFGIEQYRGLEQQIQKIRSQAERLHQNDRIDGSHLEAWDEIADVLEGSGGPSINRKKLDNVREAIDRYPQENESSTNSEMNLISKIDEISSLIDDIETAYDDEGITIPSGRSDGMASRSNFKPAGVEIKPEKFAAAGQDEENRRTTGMSSIFKRGDKGSGDTERPEKSPDKGTPVKKTPVVTDNWKKVGGQGGSNPGGFFEDENGVRYYVKTPPSQSHIESEVLAAELYKLLGIGVPEISAGTYKGRSNVISRLIDEPSRPVTGARGDGSADWQRKVTDGFVADAWLANWDAILNDNVRMDKNGNPIRVDNGGSMKWRAQGGPKGAAWGDSVGEIDSLRGQSPAAPTYRRVTPEQVKQQIKDLEALTPDKIRAVVNSIISDPNEAKELADRLIARRQDIINQNNRRPGLSSSKKLDITPEFGSQQFLRNLPEMINNSSNEELMQMWDFTRPFVNMNQYTMDNGETSFINRLEKIKKDVRSQIKNEISLRQPGTVSRQDMIKRQSTQKRTDADAARINQANSIRRALDNRSNSIKKSYSAARIQEDQHSAVWDDVSEALTEDGQVDLTNDKLDSMIEILNNYLAKNKNTAKNNQQQTNIRQAEKMRDTLNGVSEGYADDPYIERGSERTAKPGRTVGRVANQPKVAEQNQQDTGRVSRAPSRTTAQYISARKNETRRQGMTSEVKGGRAEIRAEATFFKSVQDMLLHEAGKSDDANVASALRTLNAIMTRQKSGLISDKRTNAGAIYLTQKEIDSILDALFMAIDRQTERGGSDRAKLLADFADIIAKAAMSTFIDKSVPEVNSRTVKKINSEGREVEIPLNE